MQMLPAAAHEVVGVEEVLQGAAVVEVGAAAAVGVLGAEVEALLVGHQAGLGMLALPHDRILLRLHRRRPGQTPLLHHRWKYPIQTSTKDSSTQNQDQIPRGLLRAHRHDKIVHPVHDQLSHLPRRFQRGPTRIHKPLTATVGFPLQNAR